MKFQEKFTAGLLFPGVGVLGERLPRGLRSGLALPKAFAVSLYPAFPQQNSGLEHLLAHQPAHCFLCCPQQDFASKLGLQQLLAHCFVRRLELQLKHF